MHDICRASFAFPLSIFLKQESLDDVTLLVEPHKFDDPGPLTVGETSIFSTKPFSGTCEVEVTLDDVFPSIPTPVIQF